ncbi:hypothetical protein AB0K02_15000 [Streptomyces sp. NPDC049597]|uniref:hypothetical protein n=1 Tax=Streptomyces sp. NPDC049597 TaxID=3155276 RepID=UPI00343DC40E
MPTLVRALAVCTVAGLVAVVAVTVAAGSNTWLWAAGAVFAAVTVDVRIVDRRQRA